MEYRLKSSQIERKNFATKSRSSCTRQWSWIQSPDVSFHFSMSKRKRQIEKLTTTWSKSEKNKIELTTTDWEIYLAPLMFSYNTSFNQTFQISPHFVIFGQHARQPAFNHGKWEKKNLGDSPAAKSIKLCRQHVKWLGKMSLINSKWISKFMSISQHLMNSSQNSGFCWRTIEINGVACFKFSN